MLQHSCLENPFPWTEKPGRPQSAGSQNWTGLKRPCIHRCKTFHCLWQLCPSESWVWRWHSCLACGDAGGTLCGDTDCLHRGSYGPTRVFFWASCSWPSESLFDQSFSIAPPIQAHRGASRMGSSSVDPCIRCLMGQPRYCSAADAGVRGERLWWWLHPLHMTQQYRLASMAAWLSLTGNSLRNLLPQVPLVHLSTVNSSPHPGITPQPPCSSFQPLHLPGDLHPCSGYVWLR